MNTNPAHTRTRIKDSSGLNRFNKFFNDWNCKEIEYVRTAVTITNKLLLRKLSILVSKLGNGWLYVFIILLILIGFGVSSWPLLIITGLIACLSHCFYPLIKKRLARIRPCDYDPSINLSVKVLDQYSCPSGHVMTATAVAIPLAVALPGFLPIIIFSCLLIAWSRISLGHHYPSDLLFGAILGSFISIPMSIVFSSWLTVN